MIPDEKMIFWKANNKGAVYTANMHRLICSFVKSGFIKRWYILLTCM